MPTFGPYETLSDEPVAERKERGHVTTLWQARRGDSGDGRVFAIKVYTPIRRTAQGAADEDLDEDPCLGFLEGVKRLGKAQQEGGRCLAKVFDVGRTDGGVWCAAEFRERGSLEEFIARKLNPGGAGLRHVVSSVVAGCLALKRSSGQSHGGLKSSNVLLASSGPALPKTALELTDAYPASLTAVNRLGADDRHAVEEILAQAIELQDLRCIGELILQLVEQRPVRSAYDYNYPIQIAPAWTGLGKEGEWWLELCNRLLDPHLAPGTISLESLANEIRPGAGAGSLKKIALAAAAVVVVLGLVSGGIVVVKKMKAGSAAKTQAQYESATNSAGAALATSDFAEAIIQAEAALKLKPDDPAATDLLKKAQLAQTTLAESQRQARYQSATNAAQNARSQRNYPEVIRQADLALAIQPNDPVATRLKQEAQQAQSALTQADRDYQSATNAAMAALQEKDYPLALRQADAALKVRSGDAFATRLRSDAERGQVQAAAVQKAYQGATNSAGAALKRKDYPEAIHQADVALGLKPNDQAAARLKATAQREQDSLAQAERDYQSATNKAGAALLARNYAEAIRQADLALGLRPNDPTATSLKRNGERLQATLAQAEQDYQRATNSAGVALGERNYEEAIRQADLALEIKPNDVGATRLKADAQEGQRQAAVAEQKYRSAMSAADQALVAKNYTKAIQHADVALGIKPGDTAATKLKTSAQEALTASARAEKDYQSATNAAGVALGQKEYSEAKRQADVALRIKPNDAVATKLKAEAQTELDALAQAEQDYRSATNSAGLALKRGAFQEAIRQAEIALKLKADDATATKLKDEAQSGQAAALQAEKNYQAATNAAGVALGQGNYEETIRQATTALQIKSDDPSALSLKNQAQAQLRYQGLMQEGRDALGGKDYDRAIARADDALKIRTGDADATKLRSDAMAGKNAAENEAAYNNAIAAARSALEQGDWSQTISQADLALAKKPNDPEAAKIKQSAGERMASVRALDNEFQTYQVMFGLAKPRDDLRYQGGQRVEPLPNRQIDQSYLDKVLKRVTALGPEFKQAGSLNSERQDALRKLEGEIKGWNNRY